VAYTSDYGMCVSSVRGVEKPAAEEPSGRRLLEWVVRHSGWTCGRDAQPVDL